jgi:hypothetical protein
VKINQGRRSKVPRTKALARKVVEGTDMEVLSSPSYIRIAGPEATVAYGFYRSDGSLRLQVRRPDGMYPETVIVEDDADLPMAREALEDAERRLSSSAGARTRARGRGRVAI